MAANDTGSPGLTRALQAAASPRRGTLPASYARSGARRERERLARAGVAVALGLLVAVLFFLWEFGKASGYTFSHWGLLGRSAGDDYDQGAYVVSAQLLNKGFALFRPVFSAQPAFFLPSLALVLRLVHDPVAGGYIYEALFGLATLLGVFVMAWSAYRPLAAPLATAVLAVSPGFLLYAHAVEAEMPMVGLCTLSVAAAQVYYLTGRRSMAALSGLLLMAGTEMKLLSVVFLPPLVLLLGAGVWRRYRANRSLPAVLLDALAFALCLAVPALVVLGLFSPSEQLRQVVIFHLAAGKGPADLASNIEALRTYLGYDLGLLLIAAAGAVVGLWVSRTRYLTLVYALWFLGTLAFLWRYHPLFQHQFAPLMPPLALLGAGLSAAIGRRSPRPATGMAWTDFVAPAGPSRLALLGAGLVAAAYLGITIVRTLPINDHLFAHPVTPNRDRLIAMVQRTTRPGDFIVADDPMIALLSGRLMPPEMGDPSRVRTTAGYLTVGDAIKATEQYHPAAIIASRPMFAIYLQGYLTWARAHYRTASSPVPGAEVYLRPQ